MKNLIQDLNGRVPTAKEIDEVILVARALRAQKMREITLAIWSRITGLGAVAARGFAAVRHA